MHLFEHHNIQSFAFCIWRPPFPPTIPQFLQQKNRVSIGAFLILYALFLIQIKLRYILLLGATETTKGDAMDDFLSFNNPRAQRVDAFCDRTSDNETINLRTSKNAILLQTSTSACKSGWDDCFKSLYSNRQRIGNRLDYVRRKVLHEKKAVCYYFVDTSSL